MNKYQKALESNNELISMLEKDYEDVYDLYDDIEVFKELVEKATPKKIDKAAYPYACPVCLEFVSGGQDYCMWCGQRLDNTEGGKSNV